MEKMKVLFLSRKDYLSSPGGDTVQMLKTQEALRVLGVEVDVTLETTPDLTQYDLVHLFNIQHAPEALLQLRNAKEQKKPVAVSTIYWDLRHIYKEPDFFHYHKFGIVRILAKFWWRLPQALFPIIRMPRQRTFREMLSRSDLLLPNSVAEAEHIALIFDRPEFRAKMRVVPNGVSENELNVSGAETEISISRHYNLPQRYVLQVGRIEYLKGQLKLINALADYPDIPLVFVGRDNQHHYYKECRRSGTLRGATWFIDEIPHDRLPELYRNAAVHVLPSLRESPGLVTLEAALYQTNCVVSIHGPVMEYFGDTVWYCNPAKTTSIREAVIAAWNSPYQDDLRKMILQNFTWEVAARKTLDAYEWLLEQRS